jgi:hypothetical protein
MVVGGVVIWNTTVTADQEHADDIARRKQLALFLEQSKVRMLRLRKD